MASESLSTQDIVDIEVLIRNWKTKFTWHLLVERIESDLGISTTRQTLPKYPSIKKAYDLKKLSLRGTPPPELVEFIKSDLDLYEENERLKTEKEVLKRKLEIQLDFIKKLGVLAKSNPSLVGILNDAKRGRF